MGVKFGMEEGNDKGVEPNTTKVSLKLEKLFCGQTICRDHSKFKVT